MSKFRYFIYSVFICVVTCLVFGLAFDHAAVAQNVDTTVKPLPDFIKNRPIPEDASPAAPAVENGLSDFAAPKTPPPQNESSFDDIPDAYIIEASKFAERCRNHAELPLMFDCRCLSIQYLDARIDLGPDVSASMVQNELGGECKDATLAAGQIYESCLLDISNAPTHLDPEEFCGCYANKYAMYFELIEGPVPRAARINLKARASFVCENPAGARRVYGPDPIP